MIKITTINIKDMQNQQEKSQPTKFKAIIRVNGKETAFANSYKTPTRLMKGLKENGINIKSLIRVEEFFC